MIQVDLSNDILSKFIKPIEDKLSYRFLINIKNSHITTAISFSLLWRESRNGFGQLRQNTDYDARVMCIKIKYTTYGLHTIQKFFADFKFCMPFPFFFVC